MSIFVKLWLTCMTKVASGRKKWPLASTSLCLGMSQLWGFANWCELKKFRSIFVKSDFCKNPKSILTQEKSFPELKLKPNFTILCPKVVQSMYNLWYFIQVWRKTCFSCLNLGSKTPNSGPSDFLPFWECWKCLENASATHLSEGPRIRNMHFRMPQEVA